MLRKKECIGEIRNTRLISETTEKTTVVNDRIISLLMQVVKNPQQLAKLGVPFRRLLYVCQSVSSNKSQKTDKVQLEFTKTSIQDTHVVSEEKNILWTDSTRMMRG